MNGKTTCPNDLTMRLDAFTYKAVCTLFVLFVNNTQAILSNVRGLERSGTNMIQGFFEQCKLAIEGDCVNLMQDGISPFNGHSYLKEKGISTFLSFPRPDQDRPCWKHFRNRGIHSLIALDKMAGGNRYTEKNLVYFITIKNPYAWIPSYCGFHLKCHMDNITTMEGLVYDWNEYVTKWLYLKDLHPDRIILVRYEQLLSNAYQEFTNLLMYLRTNEEENAYQCLASGAQELTEYGTFNGRNLNVMMSHGKRWPERKKYYLECEYFEKLTLEQIKLIDSKVSVTALRKLGYHHSPCLLWAKRIIANNVTPTKGSDSAFIDEQNPLLSYAEADQSL